jgi:hypothetical protein
VGTGEANSVEEWAGSRTSITIAVAMPTRASSEQA